MTQENVGALMFIAGFLLAGISGIFLAFSCSWLLGVVVLGVVIAWLGKRLVEAA